MKQVLWCALEAVLGPRVAGHKRSPPNLAAKRNRDPRLPVGRCSDATGGANQLLIFVELPRRKDALLRHFCSSPWCNSGWIRPALNPAWLRCSTSTRFSTVGGRFGPEIAGCGSDRGRFSNIERTPGWRHLRRVGTGALATTFAISLIVTIRKLLALTRSISFSISAALS